MPEKILSIKQRDGGLVYEVQNPDGSTREATDEEVRASQERFHASCRDIGSKLTAMLRDGVATDPSINPRDLERQAWRKGRLPGFCPTYGEFVLSEAEDIFERKVGNEDAAICSGDGTPGGDALSGEAKALALLVKHPEWTDTKIAETVGCHRTTLYNWPRFVAARAAMKDGRASTPRGSKYAGDGVESWQ